MRRPRTILSAAVTLLVVVIGLFGVALMQSHADDRRDAERRFEERAHISASLTESIFSSSAGQTAAQHARRFGGATIDQRQLDRLVREGRLAYAAVLDARGRVLATSTGLPADIRDRLARRPVTVRAALAGRPFALSDFLTVRGTPGVLEYASPFASPAGPRVMVQGFPVRLISAFLGGYLGDIPDAQRATAYVVDSQGRVVGSPDRRQVAGRAVRQPGLVDALRGGSDGEFDSAGETRSFTSAPVKETSWRVVLSMPSSALYADIDPLVQWLVLVALAAAGMAAVFLLARTVRATAAVADTNEQLEQANAELAHSNRELQRSNAELEQFASVASHDLQEPLRKVQTFGDQLEHRFAGDLPPEAVDYLRRMRASAGRMSALIDDLLRFSRVGTKPPRMAQVDLGEAAREVVAADLDGLVRDTHGRVDVEPLGTVEADPSQMRQLLQNLIANALKFHRPEVAPEVHVRPAPAAEPGTIAFEVADNGIGFDPRYEERIFRVFERLHPRDVYPGTGIGLALCRKIVERHGGQITAAGAEDGGARFTVTLPIVAARPMTAEAMGMAHPAEDAAEERVAAHV
ncbi:MAG TPA: ATP-binding protein [Baekduia sp.]|nr:ATP-binding protein [Baekduia sp.]